MLSPALSLRLGDRIYAEQVAGLTLRRARLPGIDRLSVLFPIPVPVDAAPGDPVTLKLDGGEGAETVFTGRLGTIRRRFDGITLTALDFWLSPGFHHPVVTQHEVSARKRCSDFFDLEKRLTHFQIHPSRHLQAPALANRSSVLRGLPHPASSGTRLAQSVDGGGALQLLAELRHQLVRGRLEAGVAVNDHGSGLSACVKTTFPATLCRRTVSTRVPLGENAALDS